MADYCYSPQRIVDLSLNPSGSSASQRKHGNSHRRRRSIADSGVLNSKKIVIVGDGAAGKTSLLTCFAKGQFDEKDGYNPTVFDSHTVPCIFDNEECELQLWDTAGQEDYDRLRPLSYSEADLVLIAYAVNHPASLRNVGEKWAPEIRHYLPGCPIILVGLKADLFNNGNDDVKNSKSDQEEMARMIRADQHVLCSAKTGMNVERVFQLALATINSRRKRSSGALRLKDLVSCLVPGMAKNIQTVD